MSRDGVTAIVIAGEALGVKSPVYTRTPVHYLHFQLEAGATLWSSLLSCARSASLMRSLMSWLAVGRANAGTRSWSATGRDEWITL